MRKIRASFVVLALVGLASAGHAGCGRSELDLAVPGAGDAAVPPTSGLPQVPSTPGLFLCGTTAICRTATQSCCIGVTAGGAPSTMCTSAPAACAGASFGCDEPADCSASDVCCFGLQAASGAAAIPVGSSCTPAATCAGLGRVVVCRKNSDCGPGTICCSALGLGFCQASCPTL